MQRRQHQHGQLQPGRLQHWRLEPGQLQHRLPQPGQLQHRRGKYRQRQHRRIHLRQLQQRIVRQRRASGCDQLVLLDQSVPFPCTCRGRHSCTHTVHRGDRPDYPQ
nr:hypothetical protein [Mycobacterium kansasii]